MVPGPGPQLIARRRRDSEGPTPPSIGDARAPGRSDATDVVIGVLVYLVFTSRNINRPPNPHPYNFTSPTPLYHPCRTPKTTKMKPLPPPPPPPSPSPASPASPLAPHPQRDLPRPPPPLLRPRPSSSTSPTPAPRASPTPSPSPPSPGSGARSRRMVRPHLRRPNFASAADIRRANVTGFEATTASTSTSSAPPLRPTPRRPPRRGVALRAAASSTASAPTSTPTRAGWCSGAARAGPAGGGRDAELPRGVLRVPFGVGGDYPRRGDESGS